jgi:hypothetical protein
MCRNPRMWIGLGVVAVIVAITAPNVGAVLPILLVAACPLMMLVMMGGMAGMARGKGRDATSSSTSDVDEVARLRAEIDELRARR